MNSNITAKEGEKSEKSELGKLSASDLFMKFFDRNSLGSEGCREKDEKSEDDTRLNAEDKEGYAVLQPKEGAERSSLDREKVKMG